MMLRQAEGYYVAVREDEHTRERKPETKENYIKSSLQPEDGDDDDEGDDEKLDVQNASIKGSEKPTELFFR